MFDKMGGNIQHFRKISRVKGMEMAERVGVSYTHYKRIESGASLPSLDTLTRICEILEVPLDVVLKDSGVKAFQAYAGSKYYKTIMDMDDKEREIYINILQTIYTQIKGK